MTVFTGKRTHEYLLAELIAIHENPRTGWNSPRGVALLKLAEDKFSGLARGVGADPSDAAAVAWGVWRDAKILGVANVWKYTHTTVKNALRTDAEAAWMLTSPDGLRRKGIEYFVGTSEIDDANELAASQTETRHTPLRSISLLTAIDLLASHGYALDLAEDAVESMIVQAAHSTSPQRAADELVRETHLPDVLGIRQQEWNAIASLLFGSPRGAVGILEAERKGIEPSEKHVRLTLARFERARIAA